MFRPKNLKKKNTNKYPDWMNKFKEKYKSSIGNIFLITGNITDYPAPGKSFDAYMDEFITKEMGVNEINYFDIEKGLPLKHAIDNLKEETENKKALIIKYPEFIFDTKHGKAQMQPEDKVNLLSLLKLLESNEFATSKNMLFMLSETKSEVPKELLGANTRMLTLSVGYPDIKQREEFIDFLDKSSQVEVNSEISKQEFANLTAGLGCKHIEDIYLLAETKGVLTSDMVSERKDEIIEKVYGELVEIYDTTKYSLDDYAGLNHVKEILEKDILSNLRIGNRDGLPVGMLYTGAPGTGKTYLSQCIAGSAKVNFVEIKLGKLMNKYVGETEHNLEKVFQLLESMSPTIGFIDEIDQALSRGGNDSNAVRSNVFGMFLSFMSKPENRGRVLFVGATNYPNKMDEALKRIGRFDVKIPFFPPNKKDRKEVFNIHLNKQKLSHNITDEDLELFSEKTNGFTHAEIEGIVVKAVQVTKRRNSQIINKDILSYAFDCIIHAQNEKIFEMSKLALLESNDLEYLDDEYRKIRIKLEKDRDEGLKLLREKLS